jgi:hypothetical protein
MSGSETLWLRSPRTAVRRPTASRGSTVTNPPVGPIYPDAGLTPDPAPRYEPDFRNELGTVIHEDDLYQIACAIVEIARDPRPDRPDRLAFTGSDGRPRIIDLSSGTFALTYAIAPAGGVVFHAVRRFTSDLVGGSRWIKARPNAPENAIW